MFNLINCWIVEKKSLFLLKSEINCKKLLSHILITKIKYYCLNYESISELNNSITRSVSRNERAKYAR